MENRKKAGTKENSIKKVLYPVSAVVLALGLGIGAILLSMLDVQASTEMMPGIEQILADKSDNDTPFRILELVNDSADAEIGYYISGQEPYLTQYKYTPIKEDGTKGDTQTFSSIEEGLSVLPTKEERQEFVEASDTSQIKNPLDFSWNEDNPGTTKKADYPLSFKSYAEKYFLSKTDDATKWNRVDLKETRKETLIGHYEENSSGKGDYTKEEQQYYPIREDVKSDGSTTQKYRENIKNFFYSDDTEASAPYQLSFEEVNNNELNAALNDDNDTMIADDYDYSKGGFGYYENVYGELTSEIAENIAEKKYTFPGENPTVADTASGDSSDDNSDSASNGTNNSDANSDNSNDSNSDGSADTQSEVDISDTDDLTGGEDDGTAVQNDVTTAGTQVNPKIYRGENIDEHPYYKYTLVGDLKYVKEQAEKNKNTSNRKDGDITLEDGQYWYWTEESTDSGEGSDADTSVAGDNTSAESSGTEDSDTTDSDTTDGTSTQSAQTSGVDKSETASKQSADSADNSDAATDSDAGNDTVMKKEALYIVTGRQAVSKNQVKAIPDDFTYSYYYKVRSIKYCSKLSTSGQETDPEAYTYYGWYYASHPSNEDTYLEASKDAKNASEETEVSDWNTKATHYISEAQYTLTPGKGGYDFVEGTSVEDTKQSVEIDHLFYQGGYTNHDWFKRYVFHLDPDSEDETIQEQFKNLSITVDTRVINTNGTGTDASELPKSDLDEYDLIYVNGKLSSTQASNIAATTKLPAIINQEKAMGTDEDKAVIEKRFAAYVDEDYLNTSYVSQRIYFTNGALCNLEFHTDFTDDDTAKFSEIIDYINSENNYREVIESGENGEKTEPLAENISQARVIEYIINYQYKRETAHKDTINVLDIEPASKDASLTVDNVKKWLNEGQEGEIVDYCCEEEKDGNYIKYATDGNLNTFWHTKYNGGQPDASHRPHWFLYKLSNSKKSLKGIYFAARPKSNTPNGRPYELKLTIMDSSKKEITTKTIQYAQDAEYWKKLTENFDEPIKNAAYIKVEYTKTYYDRESANSGVINRFAACAAFGPLYEDDTEETTQINITHMTSSEFVGHIDDINTEYDAIYFGDSYSNWDFRRNGDVTVKADENSQGKKVSLYSHSGGVFGGIYDRSYNENGNWLEGIKHNRWVASRLMGLLDIDYAKNDSGEFIRDKSLNLKLLRSPNNTPGEIGEKIGRMRGSGNDITKQQLKELKDFVSSGYPVIIGNKLLNNDGTEVNTDVVDSSSYIYEFLNSAIDKEKDRVNVMSKAEADQKQNLNFFFYMAKPKINFEKIPPEPERLNNETYKYNKEAEIKALPQSEDGLTYEFTIENDSEISTANATYNCELFIDLNFDGNLSSQEEQSEYMQIQDDKGNVVKKENGKYHLKIGKKYTLTRKIPKDYYKVITWKIQISNNENSAIRTSRMGFTKRQPEKEQEQTINVLQIYPKQRLDANGNVKSGDGAITWYLDKEYEDKTSDFSQMLSAVKDFNIVIDGTTTEAYVKKFKEAEESAKTKKEAEENKAKILEHYQMIIIGFADGFGIDNIDNANGAVDAIRDFIEDGKSVLFSHDTTSFVNTDEDVLRPASVGSDNTPSLYNPDTWPTLDPMPAAWNWGYSLNTFLRAKVGMDRYGITSDEKVYINGEESTVSAELKKGNDLKKSDGIYDTIKDKVSDMAYVFGDKNTSSLMTQGFSNNVLDNNNHYSDNVSKVNEGAITQYPNYIADLIPTSRTHSQYYQLAMEEDSDQDGMNDIVVWYCLSGEGGGDGAYQSSPNDVRNNYYFYSKGNVIYTGVGHSGQADAKTGNITKQEKELFVNAIVAAANVSAVEPEATFLDDFDPVSEQEEYRYYMPDRLKASEVSGTSSNILDGDNTFNIRIRDYNMVASNLNYKDDDNSNSLTMELYIEDENGNKTITVDGKEVQVSKISDPDKVGTLKKYSDGQTIEVQSDGKFKGKFILPGNDTFQFTLNNMESYLKEKKTDGSLSGNYKKECRIFAKIESAVVLYGTKADKETWTSISLKPRQLFDLD